MPKFEWIKKVLIIGSGGIRIGQAAEFDYSGSQALKALREEGIKTVLINPNIATIQTSKEMADKIYLEPITPEFVEKVIAKEKPDGIMLSFGGQTSLNIGVKLARLGVLQKYNVKILGTPIEAIEKAEDRALFKEAMKDSDVRIPTSYVTYSMEDAERMVDKTIYPVIVRTGFMLGGGGSGVAKNRTELINIVKKALGWTVNSQVLIEEYLAHWKEIEYEIVRDMNDNTVIICAMEGFDPLGIHTGEKIVVAPTQTLTNKEYHMMREAAIRIVKTVNIIGECNIQFALDPKSERFVAIEMNPRMSRSSALASKATGYPLAYIAAKLAIGYTLPELKNNVTGITIADFEPALDYAVVKIPKWDFQKFPGVNRDIGSQMKSVGEVMAIGRCFEEALQKALRCLDLDLLNAEEETGMATLRFALSNPTDKRIFRIVDALRQGMNVGEIHDLTGIDKWFLCKIKNILDMENALKEQGLNKKILAEAKKLGFSDEQIGKISGKGGMEIRRLRKELGITPSIKQIDTLAAEWPAQTNYLYVTYGGYENDDTGKSGKEKVLVIGSGPIRIGSSVEFDWCTMNCVWALRSKGYEAIVLNCNPETVSTDYDMSDKLYFEEITLERVMDIIEHETKSGNFKGVVVSVGGQTPNNLAKKLAELNINILGTSAESIDIAEDRSKFSKLLDELGIKQPLWLSLNSMDEIKESMKGVEYPVIVRPSYVLSGAAMRVAYNEVELKDCVKTAAKISAEYPVVVSKFIENAREVEVDAVSDGNNVLVGSIIEHIEQAGVHSGDAVMVIPPQSISKQAQEKIVDYTKKIALSLKIKGPFNMQYITIDGTEPDVFVIECNLRASRSMPFVSKATNENLITIATNCMLGEKLKIDSMLDAKICVKSPMFSFIRLSGSDPLLGVEMLSTGEVACLGDTFQEALVKSFLATEIPLPSHGNVLLSLSRDLQPKLLDTANNLRALGYAIFTTEGNAERLANSGFKEFVVLKKIGKGYPNVLDFIQEGKINLVITVPGTSKQSIEDERTMRVAATELQIPVFTQFETVEVLIRSLLANNSKGYEAKSLDDYFSRG
ncbi:MAG: carbamoyl-phosphate synthase (glutamine-hydrolyzing) large subunit [Candidatus Aenigmatarchaeota archaeon]